MEKAAEQRQKDFDKTETQLKKAALKPSEQELIGVKAFLEAGKEALDTKFKEFQTALKKANDLKTLLNEQQRVSSEAAEAYRQLDGPEVKGKVYDKQKHEQQQMQSPYHKVVQGQAKPQQPVAQQAAREMKKPETQAVPVRGK